MNALENTILYKWTKQKKYPYIYIYIYMYFFHTLLVYKVGQSDTLLYTNVFKNIYLVSYLFVWTDVYVSCVNVSTLLFRPRPLSPIGQTGDVLLSTGEGHEQSWNQLLFGEWFSQIYWISKYDICLDDMNACISSHKQRELGLFSVSVGVLA